MFFYFQMQKKAFYFWFFDRLIFWGKNLCEGNNEKWKFGFSAMAGNICMDACARLGEKGVCGATGLVRRFYWIFCLAISLARILNELI